MTGMEVIAALAGSLVSDAAAAQSVALAGTLGFAVVETVKKLSRRRMEAARDIMVEEVRLGTKSLDDAAQLEEIVACMLRYGRAAEEGAARLNLRLMAAVLNGLVATRPLYASEFLRFSKILSELRRDECLFLAVLIKESNISEAEAVWNRARQFLVPQIFQTEELMKGCALGLLRTGLLSVNFGGIMPIGMRDGTSIPEDEQQKITKLAGGARPGAVPIGVNVSFYGTSELTTIGELIINIESVLERDRRMNEQHAAAKDL
jgi:hypothetical protein